MRAWEQQHRQEWEQRERESLEAARVENERKRAALAEQERQKEEWARKWLAEKLPLLPYGQNFPQSYPDEVKKYLGIPEPHYPWEGYYDRLGHWVESRVPPLRPGYTIDWGDPHRPDVEAVRPPPQAPPPYVPPPPSAFVTVSSSTDGSQFSVSTDEDEELGRKLFGL
jgi:hypothetical protein